MKLRKIDLKDATLMLEWMHDLDVVGQLQTNFQTKNIEDCKSFIISAQDIENDMHLAIADEDDNYIGTVSLKHIVNRKAEFAITIRKSAMGKGYSKFGMNEILRIGFEKLGLEEIYWCVSKDNIRAIKFYDKNGYKQVSSEKLNIIGYDDKQIKSYIWYLEKRS